MRNAVVLASLAAAGPALADEDGGWLTRCWIGGEARGADELVNRSYPFGYSGDVAWSHSRTLPLTVRWNGSDGTDCACWIEKGADTLPGRCE